MSRLSGSVFCSGFFIRCRFPYFFFFNTVFYIMTSFSPVCLFLFQVYFFPNSVPCSMFKALLHFLLRSLMFALNKAVSFSSLCAFNFVSNVHLSDKSIIGVLEFLNNFSRCLIWCQTCWFPIVQLEMIL